MSKLTLDTVGQFGFSFYHKFFIETAIGNFVWSDPDYPGGDNTIIPFDGNLKDFCKQEGIPYVRDKGTHIIGEYCGKNVIIKEKEGN